MGAFVCNWTLKEHTLILLFTNNATYGFVFFLLHSIKTLAARHLTTFAHNSWLLTVGVSAFLPAQCTLLTTENCCTASTVVFTCKATCTQLCVLIAHHFLTSNQSLVRTYATLIYTNQGIQANHTNSGHSVYQSLLLYLSSEHCSTLPVHHT
jgi:hypothetical protein